SYIVWKIKNSLDWGVFVGTRLAISPLLNVSFPFAITTAFNTLSIIPFVVCAAFMIFSTSFFNTRWCYGGYSNGYISSLFGQHFQGCRNNCYGIMSLE